jgi:hypothetical protein
LPGCGGWCISAFLGIDADLAEAPPPYLRVLGCNARGREVLSRAKVTCSLPDSTSLAVLERQSERCARYARLEAAATDQFALCAPTPQPCGTDYTTSAVFLDK